MSSSYNRVILMGNLTRDPEIKFVSGDRAIANFGLAVNKKYKTKDGEQREEVAFIDCEAWGYTAENIGKFFHKGRAILVEGRLKQDTWDDKATGAKRSKLLVSVDNFQFVGDKQTTTGTSAPPATMPNDDLPF